MNAIIGIGCDIVQISRLEKHSGPLARRILSPKEFAKYQKLSGRRQIEYLAGRFAAKEALIKAAGFHHSFQSLEILNTPEGKPVCALAGHQVFLSISHEREYATAMAIVQADSARETGE